MRKLISLAILVALSAISMASVDRTAAIRTGSNMLARPLAFTTADSVVTSDTLVISIVNIQKYMQHQVFSYTIDSISGNPSIQVIAYGRVTSTGSWVQIGSTTTWDDEADNTQTITSTSPVNYNYLKVEFVASGTTQKSRILTFDVRTANVYDIPSNAGTVTFSRATTGTVTLTSADNNSDAALTIAAGGTGALTLGESTSTTALTGSAVNINASLNIATNINTGTSSGALSLGGGSGTVAVNSSAWDVTTAGVATGLTSVTVTKDADNVILDPGTDLHAIDVQINSASKFSVDSAGNVVAAGTLTPTGAITMTGGYTFTGASPVIWTKGGAVALATSGADSACTVARRYWVEVDIPYNVTLTGIAYLIGSVGGTDSVVVQLCNSAGVEVATSRAPGTAAALVSTTATFQSVPFTATYAAVAGKYFAVLQFNGTTAKFRTYPITGCKYITGTAAGVWKTKADITPGTTYTAGKGPILMTY